MLDNQYQYCRNQESGKSVGWIIEGDILILYRVGGNLVLAVGGIGASLHFDVCVHGKRHVGVGSQQGFVIQQSAHVAEDADLRLLTAYNVVAEGGGDVDNTVCPAVLQHQFGFFHISAVAHEAHFGTGVHFPQVFAAQRGA